MRETMYFLIIVMAIFLVGYFIKTLRIVIKVLGCLGAIGFPICIGLFYGIFHNNLSFEYEPAIDCTITTLGKTHIPNSNI